MTKNEVELSILVPIHNSTAVLPSTIHRIHDKFQGTSHEILLVENASQDNSWELCNQLHKEYTDLNIRTIQSEPGLGSAIKKGIRESSGKRVFITADELPFGFDEFDQADYYPDQQTVVIGSKAHPGSIVPRGWKRNLSSLIFRFLRLLVLGSKIGDSQGTFVLNGDWIRSRQEKLTSSGFLITAEIVELAERDHLTIVEVPVKLRNSHDLKKSSVKPKHVISMLIGIFSIRINRGK